MTILKRKIRKGSFILALSLMLVTPVMAATTIGVDIWEYNDTFEGITYKSAVKYTLENYVEKKTLTIDSSFDDPGDPYYEANIFDVEAHIIKKAPGNSILKISLDANKFAKAHTVEFMGEEYSYVKGKNLRPISLMQGRGTETLVSNGSQKEAVLSSSMFELAPTGDGKYLFISCRFYDKNGDMLYDDDSIGIVILNEKGNKTTPAPSKPAKVTPIEINGKTISSDISPIQENGSTFVPIRVVSEYLGAQVNFDPKSKEITLVKENQVIKLTIGSKKANTNGISSDLAAAPRLVNGTTFVPIRMIAESFNSDVLWDKESHKVIITEK